METPLIEILDAIEVNADLKVIRNRCYSQVKVGKRLREMTLEALVDNGGNLAEFKFFKEDGEFYHSKHDILRRNRSYNGKACYDVDIAFVIDMLMCGRFLDNGTKVAYGCQKGGCVY